MRWMIVWLNLITHQMGHGMCVDEKETAEGYAALGNIHYAETYKHWVEICGEDI